MKIWALGILLFASSCASSNDGYEIKRFHIQSRHLNGEPQCVEIRRQRSTREADYIEKVSIHPPSSVDQDAIISASQKSIVDKDAVNSDKPTEIVNKHSDLVGSAGILIVKSSSSPNNVPLVFAVRPVSGNSNNNKYLKMQIFDDSIISDDDFGDSSDDMIDDDDDDFEDYSEDDDDESYPPIKNYQNHNQRRKNSKRKHWVYSQIVESGADSLEYNVKPKKQSNKLMSDLSRIRIQKLRNQLSQNKKNKNNIVQVFENKDGVSNLSQVSCIIIEKEPESQAVVTEKPQKDLLRSDSVDRLPKKSYGLRKRYKGKKRF